MLLRVDVVLTGRRNLCPARHRARRELADPVQRPLTPRKGGTGPLQLRVMLVLPAGAFLPAEEIIDHGGIERFSRKAGIDLVPDPVPTWSRSVAARLYSSDGAVSSESLLRFDSPCFDDLQETNEFERVRCTIQHGLVSLQVPRVRRAHGGMRRHRAVAYFDFGRHPGHQDRQGPGNFQQVV